MVFDIINPETIDAVVEHVKSNNLLYTTAGILSATLIANYIGFKYFLGKNIDDKIKKTSEKTISKRFNEVADKFMEEEGKEYFDNLIRKKAIEDSTKQYILSKAEIEKIGEEVYSLVDSIGKAEKNIRINSDEGIFIFNHPDVIHAFKDKKRETPEIKIDAILGPVVYAETRFGDETFELTNGLIELGEEGIINIYVSQSRTRKSYVLIDDSVRLSHVKKYHPPLPPFLRQQYENVTQEDISKLCDNFDFLINADIIKKTENPRDEVLLLTYGKIRLLIEAVSSKGWNYENLDKKGLESHLNPTLHTN